MTGTEVAPAPLTEAADRLAAGVVTIFITSRFDPGPQYSNSATFELTYSTDSTGEPQAWALKGPGRIYRPG